MRLYVLSLAMLAGLAACDRLMPAPVDGDTGAAWNKLIGVWAPEGACGDYTKEWRIEPDAFHVHETHCDIVRLEMVASGVRAIAHCSVEGDDDRVEDAFNFARQPDLTLSIVNETNESTTAGLQACAEDMP